MESRLVREDDSPFDRVRTHLVRRGCRASVSGELQDDLDMLLRRYDEVRSLGEEYGKIELSPHMRIMLGVSGTADVSPVAAGMAVASV